MVGYSDISPFGSLRDGSGYSSIGVIQTPTLMGGGSPSMSDPITTSSIVPKTGIASVNPVDAWSGNGLNLRSTSVGSGAGAGKGAGNGLFGDMTGMDWGKLAIGGLQTIGSLWSAWEANKLAKEQFNFQKEFAEANMANQIQSYNTKLSDRADRRAEFTTGGGDDEAQKYIDEHSLRRK